MKRFALCALALFLFAAPQAQAESEIRQAMTVDEAYAAIPHKKTRFDAAAATMGMAERQLLDIFFGLTDLAVAERVSAMIAIRDGKAYSGNYDAILARLAALDVPEKLKRAHDLVTQAVREQRQYLGLMAAGEAFSRGAPLVHSSHQKLVAAYSELMRLYPQEGAHNRTAFFDHLCALDFI